MDDIPNATTLWVSVIIAALIIVAEIIRKRITDRDHYNQMTWMDWCGHFALIGIGVVLISGILDVKTILFSGIILICALYPIAILGTFGRLDDAATELYRAIRRR